jgi:hypothetical protein
MNQLATTKQPDYRDNQPYGNPLVPQWCLPSWGYKGPCDTEFTYTFSFSIPANTTRQNLPLPFGQDAEFHTVRMGVVTEAELTVLEMRLRDGNNTKVINDWMQAADLVGTVSKDWIAGPGSTWRLDVRNLSGGDITFFITFRGFKRFTQLQCTPAPAGFQPVEFAPLWARYSAAPAGFIDLPFSLEVTAFAITGATTREQLGNPLLADSDALWLVRGVTVELTVSDGDSTVQLRLVDGFGNRLAREGNRDSLGFLFDTTFAGSGPLIARTKPIYPEVPVPANGYLQLDYRAQLTAGTATGVVRLHGVKRYKVGSN